MATDPSTLTLYFQPGAERVAGTAVLDGRETAFSGWLELASLIEHVRARAEARDCAETDEDSRRAEGLAVQPRSPELPPAGQAPERSST